MQRFKKVWHISLISVGCLFGVVVFLGLVLLGVLYMSDVRNGISVEERWDSIWGGKRVLAELQAEVNQLPIPEQTIFISEYSVETICCGQGEYHYKTPTVTRFYESKLTKDDIKNFYQVHVQRGGIYFVDEVIERYPDRRPNIPCYPFNLFNGHDIPQELPEDKVLYIFITSDKYTPLNPNIVYCD